ncbi:MAG: DUF5103 domain-containing protein [Salinivirgaceae bacterium]|nr:DUF5103 domain-containing protein [Salinivirgaceae bacterium]
MMILLSCFIFQFNQYLYSQGVDVNSKYETSISTTHIKTLRAYVQGNELSYPAIELNSKQKIQIEFDDLSLDSKDYYYQIIHCNNDWTSSELFSDEFMDGFNENSVNNYEFSINTTVPYIHYNVVLPNNDVEFLVSGNYVFRVIEGENRDSTILTARFSIYEPIVNIQTEIIRPLGSEFQNTGQEIRLKINHAELSISHPFNDVKVYISQNNRPDRVLKDIKPVFVQNDELVYNFSGENTFLSGNEFRIIDFNNQHKLGLNINDVQFYDSIYHVQVRLDERRSSKRYLFFEDMNGKYIINVEDGYDPQIFGDYANVYFSVPMEEPFFDGAVYIYGALNNWKCNYDSRMEYNFDKKMYEGKLLLKQGYYNYTYAFVNNYDFTIDESVLEGSHYQTENDYVIYVYHRDFAQKFDRLVGYKVVNSLHAE